jgi:hypothetical protein
MAFQIKTKEFSNIESAETFVNEFCKEHEKVLYVEIKPIPSTVKQRYLAVIQYNS